MKLYTVGYEGLNVDEFLSLLVQEGIETIVDIRELPLSRKYGFSKNILRNILNSSGLEYVHLSALGCPRPVRDQYKRDGSWQKYSVGFNEYINTQCDALTELASLAKDSNCALLCFEADYNYCHRSLVANAVSKLHKIDVKHIDVTQPKKVKTGNWDHALA